ncbi:NADH dehydrogenase [ubiquinone] 1 subunit C2 [Sitodiplosis mosellana]|uniref:NADH dehydrogenase [ubiquinone] 1 subunit C2 n=1 Tax=Sitodiplosis mosellana TaxID=263140 RepID=UPI002444486B|nr:NADH dehydrogenase [ubiquinone] 1 subunit C2 [Sitodiplosis mosellana]
MKPDPKDIPEIKFGKTALELLDSRNAEPPSVLSAYGIQFWFGLMGAGVHGVRNWTYRRPKLAGAYLYPIYFAVGAFVGQSILNWRRNYWADRDAVLRHYVQLHPEDFPPPERKKYGDVLLEWVPCR